MKIFNELVYAEKLLQNGFSRFMYRGDLIILAKYYKYLGQKEDKIEKNIVDFCYKFVPDFRIVIFSKKIKDAILTSRTNKILIPVDVPVTEHELKTIRNIGNYRYEKILFVMLVVSKYLKLAIQHNDKNYKEDLVYRESLRLGEIYRLAHITEKKDENIKKYFADKGLIDRQESERIFYLKFTDTNDQSEPKIIVTDMNDIISFYPPIYYCSECGLPFGKLSNRQTMHFECWKKKRKEKERLRSLQNRHNTQLG
jgi:hypothetical protein